MHLSNYKALKVVLKEGNFEIKGDAITAVAKLLDWYDSIECLFLEKPSAKRVRKNGDK